MKNIFIENKKLIGEIARKYGCTLDVAKDRLKADLISGGDGETGGGARCGQGGGPGRHSEDEQRVFRGDEGEFRKALRCERLPVNRKGRGGPSGPRLF